MLAPWKKSYDKLRQCFKKQRHQTLLTKVCIVKAMVFPVVMYGCESWTIKKAEHWRIDVFELWCWRRLLRVPWTARRYNQSILKEISPEYSLEVLMLKLKLQFFVHLMWRTDLLEKTLMLGKIEEFLPSLSPFLSVPSLRRWWEFSLSYQLLPSEEPRAQTYEVYFSWNSSWGLQQDPLNSMGK